MDKMKVFLYVACSSLAALNIWYKGALKDAETELKTQIEIKNSELDKKEIEILKLKIENENESTKPIIGIIKKYGSDKVLGFKNNNPGNIKGKNWYGQIGTDKQGHAIFSSEVYGIRALAKTLINYEAKGIDTIEKIVSKYAEGNNKNYIRFLSSYLNVKPNEKLNVGHKLHELVSAIITFECGSNPYPIEYFILLSWSADL